MEASSDLSHVLDTFQACDTGRTGVLPRKALAQVLASLIPGWDDDSTWQLLKAAGLEGSNTVPYADFIASLCNGGRRPGPTIVYTLTDESPRMATFSWLPIVEAFTRPSVIRISKTDISLAARILAQFPERLAPEQRVEDPLAELGRIAELPEANVVKLPNISASVPQLKAAIAEVQALGCDVPCYPEAPESDANRDARVRYGRVLGSAVNPVLRQGNSDRRVAPAVKESARKSPHEMGKWSADSRTHVASMSDGDFFGSERTVVLDSDREVRIELVDGTGQVTVLKPKVSLLAGEVVDASVMSRQKLRDFYERELQDAASTGLMCSLHLKASMMKASDPAIFGHMLSVFFREVFERHAEALKEAGVNPDNGLCDLYKKISALPPDTRGRIEADIAATYERRPPLAMVDAGKGITNLHVPSDVIIDASMPAAIRYSGRMAGPGGAMRDTKAIIPDRCYARIFQETIDFCKANGAFDPTSMGSVANVGLMAQAAEEYGSHDKTFELPAAGTVRVVDSEGGVLLEHAVESGDIWRMCQTKDVPIRDWVKLAVVRARATGSPAIVWLDPARPHEAALARKVNTYLKQHDVSGLDIKVMPPVEACRLSLQRARDGLDTISVTGNVLRDYLTDLFPILELGTSAKMLSVVPLLAGGGMFETGAGGTAPKLFRQLVEEGHLHWDSLGEYMALGASLEDIVLKTGDSGAKVLADALSRATSRHLERNRVPSRTAEAIDVRGSHFYMALYWSEALAAQSERPDLQRLFAPIAQQLADKRSDIIQEIAASEGRPVDLGGYYVLRPETGMQAMRPSPTFNAILSQLA